MRAPAWLRSGVREGARGWRAAAMALSLAVTLMGVTSAASNLSPRSSSDDPPTAALTAFRAGRAPGHGRPATAHHCGAADYADRRRMIVTLSGPGEGLGGLVTPGADCRAAPGLPEALRRYCTLAREPGRMRRQLAAIEAHNEEVARRGGAGWNPPGRGALARVRAPGAIPGLAVCKPAPGGAGTL
ncbi:MAG: hypothetical protein JWP35_3612 [Caulobacter sp.]|nr:hypothetical protein [Caulobacter sp.]